MGMLCEMERVLVSIALAMALPGQTPERVAVADEPAKVPSVHFEETTFDFGTVKNTEVKHHDFRVTNTGTGVLLITEVKPGCGCTVAGAWDRQIAPGKTGTIPIDFNPVNFAGQIAKALTVICNDPVQSTHQLTIKAKVWRPIDVDPGYVHFMPVEGEAVADTKVVRIVSNVDEPLTLEPPVVNNPALKTELKTVRAGKEYELHIAFDPARLPAPGGPGAPNSPATAISMKTSIAAMPLVTVSSYVLMQPAVQASPQQIVLPAGAVGKETRHMVMVRSLGKDSIKVLQAWASVSTIAVETKEIAVGKIFQLTVTLPGSYDPAVSPAELIVTTDHSKYSTMRVPISATKPAPQASAPVSYPAPTNNGSPVAVSASAHKDGPRAVFAETTFDFGVVKREKQRHDFVVTNKGNAVLQIQDVKLVGGCAAAGSWDREIQPGKTGTIPVEFDPTGFAGPIAKAITVACNDAVQGVHQLTLKADVWQPIGVNPPYLHFVPVEGEPLTGETRVVKIVANVETPLTLEMIESSNPALKTELQTVTAGKEYALRVTFDPALLPTGGPGKSAASGAIRFKTSVAEMSTIAIGTYAVIQPAVLAVPQQLTVPASFLGREFRQTLCVRSLGSAVIQVTDAAVGVEGVTVESKEVTPGKVFQVAVVFPANFTAEKTPAELTVKTDHPKYSVLRVPITMAPAPVAKPAK